MAKHLNRLVAVGTVVVVALGVGCQSSRPQQGYYQQGQFGQGQYGRQPGSYQQQNYNPQQGYPQQQPYGQPPAYPQQPAQEQQQPTWQLPVQIPSLGTAIGWIPGFGQPPHPAQPSAPPPGPTPTPVPATSPSCIIITSPQKWRTAIRYTTADGDCRKNDDVDLVIQRTGANSARVATSGREDNGATFDEAKCMVSHVGWSADIGTTVNYSVTVRSDGSLTGQGDIDVFALGLGCSGRYTATGTKE